MYMPHPLQGGGGGVGVGGGAYTVIDEHVTITLVEEWIRQLACVHEIMVSNPLLPTCSIFYILKFMFIACSWEGNIVHAKYIHGIYMV